MQGKSDSYDLTDARAVTQESARAEALAVKWHLATHDGRRVSQNKLTILKFLEMVEIASRNTKSTGGMVGTTVLAK